MGIIETLKELLGLTKSQIIVEETKVDEVSQMIQESIAEEQNTCGACECSAISLTKQTKRAKALAFVENNKAITRRLYDSNPLTPVAIDTESRMGVLNATAVQWNVIFELVENDNYSVKKAFETVTGYKF